MLGGSLSVFSENHHVWVLEDFMRPLVSFFQKLLSLIDLGRVIKKF